MNPSFLIHSHRWFLRTEAAVCLGLVLAAHVALLLTILSRQGPELPEIGAPSLVQASLITEAPARPSVPELEPPMQEPVSHQPEAPVARPPQQRQLSTHTPAARESVPEPELQRELAAPSAVLAVQAVETSAVAAAPQVLPPQFDAAYLDNPAPVYPLLSRRLGEEGRVMLRVRVGPDGLPIEVNVHQPSGYPRLDSTAAQTVRQWRFVPARQAGQPVDAWVLVPISFSLRS